MKKAICVLSTVSLLLCSNIQPCFAEKLNQFESTALSNSPIKQTIDNNIDHNLSNFSESQLKEIQKMIIKNIKKQSKKSIWLRVIMFPGNLIWSTCKFLLAGFCALFVDIVGLAVYGYCRYGRFKQQPSMAKCITTFTDKTFKNGKQTFGSELVSSTQNGTISQTLALGRDALNELKNPTEGGAIDRLFSELKNPTEGGAIDRLFSELKNPADGGFFERFLDTLDAFAASFDELVSLIKTLSAKNSVNLNSVAMVDALSKKPYPTLPY